MTQEQLEEIGATEPKRPPDARKRWERFIDDGEGIELLPDVPIDRTGDINPEDVEPAP